MLSRPTSFSAALIEDPAKVLDRSGAVVKNAGMFGTVTLMNLKDPKTHHVIDQVIVKELRTGFRKDQDIRAFLREVEVQLKLDDNEFSTFRGFHIPSSMDQNFPKPALVLDYMEKGSLTSYVESENLTQTQRAIIIYGLAVMIEYMHSKEVVHRDLKPDNILLTKDMKPRIIDFGLSRTLNRDGMSAAIGSPLYMAPEVTNDVDPDADYIEYDAGVDIFSFGLIIWQILNREVPYANSGCTCQADVQEMKQNGVVPSPSKDVTYNYKLAKIIEKCLCPEPEDRWNATELRDELERLTGADFGSWKGDCVDDAQYRAYVDKMHAHFVCA